MLAYTYDTLTPSVFEAMQVERFDNIYNMYGALVSKNVYVKDMQKHFNI